MYSRGSSLTKEVLADLGGRPVVVALDEPVVVVVEAELLECPVEVVQIGEGADPEELFLQGAPEALDAAVALGGTDEGGAGLHAEEFQFSLVGPGGELGAVVVAELQAGGDGHPDAAEGHPAGLVEGDHGLVAVGLDGRMDAHEFAGAVLVDAKDRGLLAVQEEHAGGVRIPSAGSLCSLI